jgi:hypothetical protein
MAACDTQHSAAQHSTAQHENNSSTDRQREGGGPANLFALVGPCANCGAGYSKRTQMAAEER